MFLTKLGPTLSLALTETVAPNPVGVGNNVTFTYTITNNGDLTTGIIFTDVIPSTATFVSANSVRTWRAWASSASAGVNTRCARATGAGGCRSCPGSQGCARPGASVRKCSSPDMSVTTWSSRPASGRGGRPGRPGPARVQHLLAPAWCAAADVGDEVLGAEQGAPLTPRASRTRASATPSAVSRPTTSSPVEPGRARRRPAAPGRAGAGFQLRDNQPGRGAVRRHRDVVGEPRRADRVHRISTVAGPSGSSAPIAAAAISLARPRPGRHRVLEVEDRDVGCQAGNLRDHAWRAGRWTATNARGTRCSSPVIRRPLSGRPWSGRHSIIVARTANDNRLVSLVEAAVLERHDAGARGATGTAGPPGRRSPRAGCRRRTPAAGTPPG